MLKFVEPGKIPEGMIFNPAQFEWFNAFSTEHKLLIKLEVYSQKDDYKLMLEALNAATTEYLVVVKWQASSLNCQYSLFFPSVEEAWKNGLEVWKKSQEGVFWQHSSKLFEFVTQRIELFIYVA